MSVLDDLEEIAEQTAGTSQGRRYGSKRQPECRNGHKRTSENTRLYKRGKHIMVICRICRQATNKRHVRYSAREYPL